MEWRGWELNEGLFIREGKLIPCTRLVEGNETIVIGIVVALILGKLWVVREILKSSPYGFIAPAWGWLLC